MVNPNFVSSTDSSKDDSIVTRMSNTVTSRRRKEIADEHSQQSSRYSSSVKRSNDSMNELHKSHGQYSDKSFRKGIVCIPQYLQRFVAKYHGTQLLLRMYHATRIHLQHFINRLKQPITIKRFSFLILLFFSVSAVSYHASLAGGDVAFIKAHIVQLGIALFSAVFFLWLVCVLTIAWPVDFSPFPWISSLSFIPRSQRAKVIRATVLCLCLLCYFPVLMQDLGGTFEHHGEYNMMAFSFLFVLSSSLSLLLGGILYFFGLKRGFRIIAGTLAVMLVAVAIAGIQARHDWPAGLNGSHMDQDLFWTHAMQQTPGNTSLRSSGASVWTKHYDALSSSDLSELEPTECRVERPGGLSFPFPALLPDGTMNFFLGSDQCPPVKQFSRVDDGALIVQCPNGNATVTSPANVWSGKPLPQAYPPDVAARAILKYTPRVSSHTYRYIEAITEEVISVKCEHYKEENLHVQHVPHEPLLKRQINLRQKFKVDPLQRKMGVSVLLLDAVSRSLFHRKMPSTSAFLSKLKKSSDFAVFEFFRYHTVGMNTGPASGAMFSGQMSAEDAMTGGNILAQMREERGYYVPFNADEIYGEKVFEENVPEAQRSTVRRIGRQRRKRMLWTPFLRSGSATGMIQGMCQDWGVTYKNTDIGLHHNIYFPFCTMEAHPYPKPYGNINGPFSIRRRCSNGRYVHKRVLDYMDGFLSNYRRLPRFLAGLFLEGHEGTQEVLKTMDLDLKKTLRKWASSRGSSNDNILNNTIVILTADHGPHMGAYPIFNSYGMTEHSLPMLFVLAPKWLLKRYPNMHRALEINQHRLLSNFDFYDGIQSLLRLPEFYDAEEHERIKHKFTTSEDRSMYKNVESSEYDELDDLIGGGEPELAGFLKEMPADRSCSEARIPERICTCNKVRKQF